MGLDHLPKILEATIDLWNNMPNKPAELQRIRVEYNGLEKQLEFFAEFDGKPSTITTYWFGTRNSLSRKILKGGYDDVFTNLNMAWFHCQDSIRPISSTTVPTTQS